MRPARVKIYSLILIQFATIFLAAAQPVVIPLYTILPAGSEDWTWTEQATTKSTPHNYEIAYNISMPTLSWYKADTTCSTGAAVILLPGGGSRVLMLGHNGYDVAESLSKKGITVFLLKYRVARSVTEDPWNELMDVMKTPATWKKEIQTIKPLALADVKAAMLYIQKNAAKFNVDTSKIGVLGFSAGSSLALNLVCEPEHMPAFAGILNIGIAGQAGKAIPENAPPVFIAGALDDKLVPVSDLMELANLWISAKSPVEFHIFEKGGHGMDIFPGNTWLKTFTNWLLSLNMIK